MVCLNPYTMATSHIPSRGGQGSNIYFKRDYIKRGIETTYTKRKDYSPLVELSLEMCTPAC